jgi:dienelactone hydrolase
MSDVSRVVNPLEEPFAGSDVGSLLGPIARVRDAQPWAADSFASDKYAPADHTGWRRRMREAVFDLLHYRPAKGDFAAEVVERTDRGSYVREKVYFNTSPEVRVPAYVLVPKDRGPGGKAPAVVALHDHGGFYRWGKEKLVQTENEHPSLVAFRDCYAGRCIADELAKQGYVVIVIDMFYWGERRMRLPDDPKPDHETDADVKKFNSSRGAGQDLVARTIESAGFTWPGLIVWDDLRTVDFLCSRPEVDATRIGCVGLSVGAWRANHLIALDDRVKAGVAVCWLTSFRNLQPSHVKNTTGFTMLIPGLYQRLDMPDVVSLAAPKPLLNINGSQDRLFPVEDGTKAAYRTLENVYAKVGAGEKFKGHLYDSPHEFNADMQAEAWAWLKKWV